MLSISLPRIFEGQGSGYPLRVSKVTLKWTGPVKILPKGLLESNQVQDQGGIRPREGGSGYPLRVSKVTLKWTGPVKILPKGQLESNLLMKLSPTSLAETRPIDTL